ncbi:hypothetical protein [Thermomonospora amylolytica]|uniref:hypothetical protein n=1 Tax=Thermomonospora amylolytica TaxID=1411117 RepID=UPI0018E5916B|nr:hypothetical protein [Thermomonospora amylolytica]
MRFSDVFSFPDSVEDEGGPGDVAGSARVQGDVLQGASTLPEFGGGAFSEGADASDQVVRGACVGMQGLSGAALRPPDRRRMPIPAPM